MDKLKSIVSYCFDCIKNEDILEKDISINVRSKAVLYPFDSDPFIFNSVVERINASVNDKLIKFHKYVLTREFETYYGYPVLFYFNEDQQTYVLAPLFVIEVRFIRDNTDLFIEKAEHLPSCGLQALNRLGLRSEEIAELGRKITTLFKMNISNQTELAKQCINIIQDETNININEMIDPTTLTNDQKMSKKMVGGLYNKSMVFAGENRIYNFNLLQDLDELKKKNDLEETSLAYLLKRESTSSIENRTLILPFQANEYQIKAIQSVFDNALTVITGPPGTGKSQFIMNLLINILHYKKSVLFVSHTNEAVNVVSDKLNDDFKNIIIRTGRKEYRQELKGKFNDLLIDAGKTSNRVYEFGRIEDIWDLIIKCRDELITIDKLEQKYEEDFSLYQNKKETSFKNIDIENSFNDLALTYKKISKIQNKLITIQLKSKKKKGVTSDSYKYRKKKKLFSKLMRSLPLAVNKIFFKTNDIKKQFYWDSIIWNKCLSYIELFNRYNAIIELESEINKYEQKESIETQIRKLEEELFSYSKQYIKNTYIAKMIGKGECIGDVNSFLHAVDSRRLNDKGLEEYIFKKALAVLSTWSSALKSLRGTFPLAPCIFDYVVFDEASQIDMPSAVPALYRAKRAIVVGDPMQLTHIAGITKDMDIVLAKQNKITEFIDIYPSRTRYCDISLYKSAENSLNRKPILLSKHYRSEDQIISLCNNTFYGGRLKIMTNLDYSKYPLNFPNGVHWINCEGEANKHPSGSRINYQEANLVGKVFKEVFEIIKDTNLSIGVVTPYSRQQDVIRKIISQETQSDLLEKHKVKILTAHKFQGSEKDIMIFSLVLASKGNGNSDIWYNIYPQILNVALSRAKYLLYIIGDKKYCHSRKGVLGSLIENYEKIKKQEKTEELTFKKKFDSPTERVLFEGLKSINFSDLGYKLIPKLVFNRYTLDFALVGSDKIDIECDGVQHEIIEGMPVIEDVERDEYLRNNGWKILRFPNHRVLSNRHEVVRVIVDSIKH